MSGDWRESNHGNCDVNGLYRGDFEAALLWKSMITCALFEHPILKDIKHMALNMKELISFWRTTKSCLSSELNWFPEGLEYFENLKSLTLTTHWVWVPEDISNHEWFEDFRKEFPQWGYSITDLAPKTKMWMSNTEVSFMPCDLGFLSTDPCFAHHYCDQWYPGTGNDLILLEELLRLWKKRAETNPKLEISVKHVANGGVPRHCLPLRWRTGAYLLL